MPNDLFEKVRVARAPLTSNFAEDGADVPHVPTVGGHEKPQKSAMSPPSPASPDEMTREEKFRARMTELEAAGVLTDWAQAQAAIEQMPMPDGAVEVRWNQIVEDARQFVTGWHDELTAKGWSVAGVFGFDNDAGHLGLVFRIRGGRTLLLGDGRAVIIHGEARAWVCPGYLPAGTTTIWAAFKRGNSK